MKKAVLALFFLFLSLGANAAFVHGNVYSAETLDIQKNSVVSINTAPQQASVAKDGTYGFFVPLGNFVLRARLFDSNLLVAEARESIEIRQDGNFVLDLVLFPTDADANILEELGQEPKAELSSEELAALQEVAQTTIFVALLATIALTAVALVVFTLSKRRQPIKKTEKEMQKTEAKKPEKKERKWFDKNAREVLALVKKAGGRATQRELYGKISFSEAQLSLILSELEAEGKIKKFKKGRGNIIVLKQD